MFIIMYKNTLEIHVFYVFNQNLFPLFFKYSSSATNYK